VTPVVAGIVVGAVLGVANLAAGAVVTRRMLHRDLEALMGGLLGGFAARLVVLVSLILVFRAGDAVSAMAFGITFVSFVFVYLTVELCMVQQYRTRSAA
jgi:hypothetical protein